ncbi:hypothetical protein [Streptomyces sp. CA-132043]|uniref:hypothetical protein n=1 Tax=Streptomyces sp. CA-132043 TaxID=3240048 RepID=UPI003D900ADE
MRRQLRDRVARCAGDLIVSLGDSRSGFCPWEDVHALTATDVAVKSLMRQVGAVRDVARR